MEIKALLFDLDGVLLDSKEAWRLAFKEVGEVSNETFENKFWGRELTKNLEEINQAGEEEQFCNEVFSKFKGQMKLMDGVRHLLETTNYPKALVTNTTLTCTEIILSEFKLLQYFDTIITSDKVKNGKPASDMIIKACDELGYAPHECALIGDSEKDIIAGRKAGCLTIGIGIKADLTISDLSELSWVLQSQTKGIR